MSVYFIQSGRDRLIKIGYSNHPEKRRMGLGVKSHDGLSLLATIDSGNRRMESDLHAQFKDHRAHGEWFYPVNELLDFIETVRDGYIPPEPDDSVYLAPILAVRSQIICRMRKDGISLAEIGRLFNISRERVRQVVENERKHEAKEEAQP